MAIFFTNTSLFFLKGFPCMASLKERKDTTKKKWQVSYTYYDHLGNRKRSSKSFDKKKDAEVYLKEVKKKENNGKKNIEYDDTMNSLINKFIEDYAKWNWAPLTYAKNVSLFDNYIRPTIGNISVKKIDSFMIKKYFLELRKVKRVPRNNAKETGELLSESIIYSIYQRLNQCFRHAVGERWIEENPLRNFAYPKPKYVKEKPMWKTSELKNALNINEERQMFLLLNIAFLACTRVGELTGLRYDAIKFRFGELVPTEIEINQEIIRLNKSAIEDIHKKGKVKYEYPNDKKYTTTLTICTPKTEGSNRIIYIPDNIAKILQEEVEYIKTINHSFKQEDREQCLLFIQYDTGRPYERDQINKKLKKFSNTYGLPTVTSHSFRHMGVQESSVITKDIKSIQANTGHSSDDMIRKIYMHEDPDKRIKLMKAIENEFYADSSNENSNIESKDILSYILRNPELLEQIQKAVKDQKKQNGSQNGSQE